MNSWLREIERATTEAEGVASARDYCSLLHPRELAPLPAECRQLHIEDKSDIPRLRQKLTEGCATLRDENDAATLRGLMEYLAAASDRLGELGRPH